VAAAIDRTTPVLVEPIVEQLTLASNSVSSPGSA
jgi:hypothetical protein